MQMQPEPYPLPETGETLNIDGQDYAVFVDEDQRGYDRVTYRLYPIVDWLIEELEEVDGSVTPSLFEETGL